MMENAFLRIYKSSVIDYLGHNSHSVFFILCFSSDNRISMDNYIYNSRSFHRLVETITHAPTMSTVKTM